METRQYMIFNTSEVSLINFEEVMETSAETIRKSNDGTKSFVKWEGRQVIISEPPVFDLDENGNPILTGAPLEVITEPYIPASVKALTTGQGPYTHTEILNILSGSEWVAEAIELP